MSLNHSTINFVMTVMITVSEKLECWLMLEPTFQVEV